MFGLMKKRCGDSCGTSEKEQYRLHYCGTCKSIGSIYGQKSRMLLNFDVVFLSELLSQLSKEDTNTWQEGYLNHNCFAPIEKDKIPTALKYTSAVNVFLSALKTQDHIHDQPSLFWNGFNRLFHSDFEKAQNELLKFGVDIPLIKQLFHSQFHIEKRQYELPSYAEPTAKITAAIFGSGGYVICKATEQLNIIGYHFGIIAYLVDALDDFEKDYKKKRFNAIRSAYQIDNSEIPLEIREKIIQLIEDSCDVIIQTIRRLPLSDSQKQTFTSRLHLNVAIFTQLENSLPKTDTLGYSWKDSSEKAGAIVRNIPNPIKRQIQYAAITLAVYVHPDTWEQLRQLDINQIESTTIGASLISALACYAGKKRQKIKRKLRKWSRWNRCVECNCCDNICNSCQCCNYVEDCFSGTACGDCCNICQDTTDKCCTDVTKLVLWILLGIIIIMILGIIIIAIS